ncbi:unnamed protein product [Rhizoctonia solani]|uniref:NAD(P)-binding protein n=1 Tax=Rhizoctonia solani TaxID=456999 RepID=A0A8H3DAB4_9AGAM|nr:unnamed protein product [Rhizoctonia solani]
MDVTSDTSVHEAVEQVIEEAGRLDVVVANAGIGCFVSGCTPTPWVGVYAATKAAARAITETLQMEAKALSPDIRVMLVITGGVRSNVINSTKFAPPPTSLYTQYLSRILARIQLSQAGPSMPTVEYVRGVSTTTSGQMTATPSSPVVLVTGSSRGGIGYSLCEAFAAKGCIVYASARRLETISSFSNSDIRQLIMDVTSDSSVHKAVEQIVEEVGRVDIVVANAGIPCHGPVLDIPIDYAKQAVDTNVLGVLRLAQAVFPYMASRKRGTFITIGSVGGPTPTPWAGVYAATKAAAHAITETLQMEAKALSPDIRVMLVLTGGVKYALPFSPSFLSRKYAPLSSLL